MSDGAGLDPARETPSADPWQRALVAARLFARDPAGIGGVVVRGAAGPVRDLWLAELTRALGFVPRRLPGQIDAERLDGGLDLAATLAAGRPMLRAGLLVETGVLLVPSAERLAPPLAARLAAWLDGDEAPAPGPALVLFDEGSDDETVAAALGERAGLWVDLADVVLPMGMLLDDIVIAGNAGTQAACPARHQADPGSGIHRDDREDVTALPDPAGGIAAMATAFGVASPRAMVLAMRVLHGHAALAGRAVPTLADLTAAVALVLGPRATQLPQSPPDASAEPPPPPPDRPDSDPAEASAQPELSADTEILLEAAHALLPPGLLAALAQGRTRTSKTAGRVGAKSRSPLSGRPAGVRAGTPGRGLRLALIDTIKAAAPWQRLRGAVPGRLAVRHDDLRVRRFVRKAEAVTIFAVDASGSAAATRLAEAKGAVELLLAEAYVARARVALVAFRGQAAELLLPPTRSLTRARRALAGLPGGGGTPIAAGLDTARAVAEVERRAGRTPLIVVLTDGRANVAAEGIDPAEAALAAARRLAAAGVASLLVDTSPRPRPDGARLADAMAARYLPLPRADAAGLAAAVRAA